MRAAARRGERSEFRLTLQLSGTPLPPLPAAADVRVRGTPYHATTELPCTVALDPARRLCPAGVVRRGRDGTASVDLRWAVGLRQLLFVQGEPVASDSAQPLSWTRQGDRTVIHLGDSETFEVVDALLTGG